MKMVWLRIGLVALPIFSGVVGYMASSAFARSRVEVRRAEIDWAEVVQPPPEETNEAMAIRRLGKSRDEVLQEAADAAKPFRVGGTLFGAWCGLVVSVKVWSLLNTPERREYVANAGRCLACARCFLNCPREHERRKRREEGETPEP